jgi:Fe-S-cluster containining protein
MSETAIRIAFTVNGKPLQVDTQVPDRRARLDELLPALRAIDDRLIAATVARHEAAGERISCQKGCAACCKRQPVPVSPPEAFALARLVDALPEPRRSAVRAAFATAVERLRAAGLYDAYMHRDTELTRDAVLAIVRRYMALALPCPFLVDDACSIYAERPFVCRQYLVTSAPALCEQPLDNPVRPVSMPLAFATAMLSVGEELAGRPQYTVPLVLALVYAAEHREELKRTHDAKATFGKVMQALKG